MEWITVISLILMGLLLIVVELVFVPGTTLVGILGFLLAGAGIFMGYTYFGSPTGHVILGVGILTGVITILVSLRTNAWQKFSLKNRIESRVNQDQPPLQLEIGEEGVTISALRPMGTALFQERHVEVQTKGNFVPAGTPIRVIQLQHHKIIVEPIS